MIRLAWRQFRTQAAVVLALVVAIGILFAITRPHLVDAYGAFAKAQASCATKSACIGVQVKIGTLDHILELVATLLVAVPVVLGAFWGAPLIAREFENGTHRLAWTQSVTRRRWLAAKLLVAGVASVAATGLLSLLVTWWSSPADSVNMNRFGAGDFGQRNVVPLGYAAFGFALGVVAGLLIRRTLPAMAATLFAFLGVRLGVTFWVRPHLLSPKHLAYALNPNRIGFGSTNGGPPTLQPGPPQMPGAWIYSTHIVDNAGHGLTGQQFKSTCPGLDQLLSGPPPGPESNHPVRAPATIENALSDCVTKIGASFHQVATYQPASRYWPLQWFEMGIFVAAAVVLIGLCFWWIRRAS